ncbi:MAG: hypothetical protein ACKO9Q_24690, partial [Pirellula sp.]
QPSEPTAERKKRPHKKLRKIGVLFKDVRIIRKVLEFGAIRTSLNKAPIFLSFLCGRFFLSAVGSEG